MLVAAYLRTCFPSLQHALLLAAWLRSSDSSLPLHLQWPEAWLETMKPYAAPVAVEEQRREVALLRAEQLRLPAAAAAAEKDLDQMSLHELAKLGLRRAFDADAVWDEEDDEAPGWRYRR